MTASRGQGGLRVSQPPKGARRLRISPSAGYPDHEFFATGYPMVGKFERVSARGEIINLETDRYKHPYLQLRSQEVTPGMSGGPVMDVARNAVAGMVNSGFMLRSDKKHRDTAFATPAEPLQDVQEQKQGGKKGFLSEQSRNHMPCYTKPVENDTALQSNLIRPNAPPSPDFESVS